MVCRRAGYARKQQGVHCFTIVFSCCPLAGSIDSLGDTRLDKMSTEVFLDQRQEVLVGTVCGKMDRSRIVRLMEQNGKCEM